MSDGPIAPRPGRRALASTSKTVTITPVQTSTLPDGITQAPDNTGVYCISDLPVPQGANYSSAALIANPGLGNVLGMLSWTKTSNWVQLAPASLAPFTAVCGLGGGLVALAKTDEGIPYIELYKSPLLNTAWPLVGTITFNNVTGVIPAMGQRNGLLYGFIKGDTNAFFTATPADNGIRNVAYYNGEAARPFFPPSINDPSVLNIPIPIAMHGQYMYAIGESRSNALYASLAAGSVARTIPIRKADTWGLYIDESINRAYGLYNDASRGNIMPYDIHDDGTLDRTGYDTIKSWQNVGMSVDPNLHLLYVDSIWNGGLKVYDTLTNQNVTPTSLDQSLLNVVQGGAWADPVNSLLIVTGVSGKVWNVGIYAVTVQP